MDTKRILPIIITMLVTGMIIYILMRQQGNPCLCDCDKMQQRIDQLEEVIGDKGDITIGKEDVRWREHSDGVLVSKITANRDSLIKKRVLRYAPDYVEHSTNWWRVDGEVNDVYQRTYKGCTYIRFHNSPVSSDGTTIHDPQCRNITKHSQ